MDFFNTTHPFQAKNLSFHLPNTATFEKVNSLSPKKAKTKYL